ncbi:MAG: hypothetical protein CMN56_10860 [Sneathiella sp.]|uniref:hypothetical protein n=1 Tax=Sneathiella sp. TaxID=1964365 RepID=UPI000C40F02C|nr:hypothetical protein [Sneathiella sp.]MAZ03629.1 hypothetical protein [Sneathiella sp.]
MNETAFLENLKDAIRYNQLEWYFTAETGDIQDAQGHYDLNPAIDVIREDQADSGGLKLSHAQRRMLMILVALWEGHIADELFGEGLGSLSLAIQSMDKNNRTLLSELIVTYPGWGQS